MRSGQSKTRPLTIARAFTLLELLVTVAIIAVLVSILSASVSKLRTASRTVMCMNNLKTVGQEFFQFADSTIHPYRGDSDRQGSNLFHLEDFQEKIYRVHEFWDAGSATEVALNTSRLPLACPAAPGPLTKRKGLPCSDNAVVPLESVSTAFNMRLDRVSVFVKGWPLLKQTGLSSRILERADVPLAFGVSGAEAVRKGVLPYYSAPPAGDKGLYGTGKFWFPSLRHNGRFNVSYVGGYVQTTPDPGTAPKSNWKYQPPLQ